LLKIDGVRKVTVDMGTGRVYVDVDQTSVPTREALAEAVKNAGFTLNRVDMP